MAAEVDRLRVRPMSNGGAATPHSKGVTMGNWRHYKGESQAVHVISRKASRQAATRYAGLEAHLTHGISVRRKPHRKVLLTYGRRIPTQTRSGNIPSSISKGMRYRLIVKISYQTGRIFIRHALTHAEYIKERWKL